MLPSALVDGDDDPPNNILELDYATSLVPSGGDPAMNLNRPLTSAPGSCPLTIRPPQPGDTTNGRALGDWDDILALTVRSEAEPFRAQVGGTTVESTLAEVFWYAGENPQDNPTTTVNESIENGTRLEPGMRRIFRRVFLIAPSLGPWPIADITKPFEDKPRNISTHFAPADPVSGAPVRWVANTLGDLTKREYRSFRQVEDLTLGVGSKNTFPYRLVPGLLTTDSEYLVLSDSLAFDVRVFDPGAPLYNAAAGTVVQPGDPGWCALAYQASQTNPPPSPAGFGAYCDLGWNWDSTLPTPKLHAVGDWLPVGSPPTPFEIPQRVGSHQAITPVGALWGYPAVYDTWSFHYENNGRDEETLLEDEYSQLTPSPPLFADPWRKTTLDQGNNGLDDDDLNGVDDVGERETSPPYDTPLRGVKVVLRIYETDARQIRETSVTHSFAE